MKAYKKLSDYDIFGYSVGLYYNGNRKEGTLFGIIFTLVYILSFIGVTIYYIAEILNRKNYTFSTSTVKHENIASIDLNKEIFALNFALQDPINYLEFIDETIYSIKANHITGKRDPLTHAFSWSYEEIKTGPCTLDNFGKNSQHFFKEIYKNKYCLYDIDKKNLTGSYVFDYYSQIIISFYPCVNSSENNNHCKSKNIIDYYLNNTYVSMFLQSITIDQKQIPMTRTYIENPYTTISQYSFKDYQILLQIVETDDDTGIITDSKKYKKILQYDYSMNMFSLKNKVYDNSFCEITIKLSDKKTIYKRRFEKITNALSKAGSLMTLIYSLIQLCSWLVVRTVYEVNIINKVFRLDINSTKNKKMNEEHIAKYLINFNSENYVKKNRSAFKKLKFEVIKNDNENEENFREINKDNSNLDFIQLKNNPNFYKDKINIKNNNLNDLNNKNIENNISNMKINNFVKRRTFNISQMPKIFRRSSDNNQFRFGQRMMSGKSEKVIDFIKFNCCQLLCYYAIKHCSNNFKIKLVKNAQKFIRKNLDIISVFQNVVQSNKIMKLILKNQEIFEILDKESYNYNKPIINDNRIEDNKDC